MSFIKTTYIPLYHVSSLTQQRKKTMVAISILTIKFNYFAALLYFVHDVSTIYINRNINKRGVQRKTCCKQSRWGQV